MALPTFMGDPTQYPRYAGWGSEGWRIVKVPQSSLYLYNVSYERLACVVTYSKSSLITRLRWNDNIRGRLYATCSRWEEFLVLVLWYQLTFETGKEMPGGDLGL